MNDQNETQKDFNIINQELETHASVATQEATRALNIYRSKYRICLNSADMDNKTLLNNEAEWNQKHQTMKTLEQIHKIIKDNKNEFDLYDAETIDIALMSYTVLATQKELDHIAKLFISYREKLFKQ